MSYRKFSKDIGLLGLTQAVTALGGIFELSIITKFLGAQSYGTWTQLSVTIGMIIPIAMLGLPYTLVRFLAGEKDENKIQDGFWSVAVIILAFSLSIALLLTLFSESIAGFFGCDRILIFILGWIIVFECLNHVQFSFFRAFQKIKTYSLFVIFRSLAEIGLIGLAISFGYGILGAMASMLIVRIVFFLIMGGLIIQEIPIKIPRFLQIKEYLAFGLPPIAGDISFWIIQSSDKYLVGFFLGTLAVGYYAPAYMLGCCLAFFISPLSFLLPAILSKHHDEDNINEVKIYLKHSLKYFLAVAIPALFGISVLSKKILTILTTKEIAEQSYYIIPFIALSTILAGVAVIFDQAINLKKKTHISGTIWLISAGLNVGLNLVFIPQWGILGAGITTLLAYAFALIAIYYYSFKELPFTIEWGFITKSIIASTFMSVIVFFESPVGLLKTLVAIASGGIAYAVFLYLCKGIDKKELVFLRKMFQPEP